MHGLMETQRKWFLVLAGFIAGSFVASPACASVAGARSGRPTGGRRKAPRRSRLRATRASHPRQSRFAPAEHYASAIFATYRAAFPSWAVPRHARAQLYRVLSPSDLRLRAGNSFCGKRPTYLTILRTASKADADIILTVYSGTAEPSAGFVRRDLRELHLMECRLRLVDPPARHAAGPWWADLHKSGQKCKLEICGPWAFSTRRATSRNSSRAARP
jgi:hypothetical protein